MELEKEARRRNDAALIAREAALKNSFGAKISRTIRLRDSASDERIKRMYGSQAARLETRMDAKLAELQERREVSVSSRLIIGGRVRITDCEE
jgi:hypothetical protein